jgi:pimeloyl-ACP methyl ester carboxylesterase
LGGVDWWTDTVGGMHVMSGKAQLAYECIGDPEGVDVFLIHAGVTDRRSWQHVIDRLSPQHRCISYDVRGYGETLYEPEDGWSPVNDALAVLDAVNSDRSCVIACSAGGQTAIDLVLAQPERVAAMVLIGSGVRGAPATPALPARTTELVARIEAAESAGDLREVNRLEAWLWLDGPSAVEGRVAGRARELFLDMNGRALQADDPGEQADSPAAWPRLDQITAPTLVMVGTLDHERIQTIDEDMASTIPGAQFSRLDGVAHLPHLEADSQTLDQIAQFVDGVR